jgi:hypothetical protein
MICPQCQAVAADDAAFCTNCGNTLARPSATPPPADRTQAAGPTYQQPAGQQYPPPGGSPYQQPPGSPYQTQPGGQQYQQPGGQQYQQPGGQQYQQQYQQPGPPYQQAGGSPYQQPGGPQYPPAGSPYQTQHGTPLVQPGSRPPTPPFSLKLSRLSPVDQVIGGASLLLIITLFLPWFGVSGSGVTVTESGMDAHGYLVISLIVAVVLVAYLILRSGWEQLPFALPIAHAPLLLIGTVVQLLFVVIAFLAKPAFLSWQFGAYLGLIAAAVACGTIVVPAIRSWQGAG